MHRLLIVVCFVLSFCTVPTFAQLIEEKLPLKRDPAAIITLTNTLQVLGPTPIDSLATGSVRIEAGGEVREGTVRVSTRGTDGWTEKVIIDGVEDAFSKLGSAAVEKNGEVANSQGIEWLTSAQTPYYPTAMLDEALTSGDFGIELLALDTNPEAIRISFWNSYQSRKIEPLAEFSRREVWIDAATHLPIKIIYQRMAGSGATPSIAMEVKYSDYRLVNGVLYPFSVEVLMNGTLWKTVNFSEVAINAGISEVADVR